MTNSIYDYIIIGAGSAGCLLANRLSADPTKRVLLIEAGGKDNYHWIHIPIGYLYCIGNPRTDWCFKTAEEPGLNGRSLMYPRGRVFGGCSSINGMLYVRGQSQDYDTWAQIGCRGWSWEEVLPIFKKSEDHYAGASEFHSDQGEWRVEEQRLHWDILDAWIEAAETVGIRRSDDFNTGDNEGVGYFKVNQRKGWRWNTASAFLNPVKQRPNLEIRTQAQVAQILFEGKKASGIELLDGARFSCRGEIILSAGAIGSPQLLQLSGIGPGAELQDKGIEVRCDSPDVGGNLQDHLQLRLAYKLENAKTLNTLAKTWLGKARMGLEYALNRSGPLSMAPSQLAAFAKSGPEIETPDLQYHVQPLSLPAFGQDLDPFPAMTASVCNLRPQSRGRVSLASPAPDAKPIIAPNYLSEDYDKMIAVRSIRLTRQIMEAQPLAAYKPEEFRPGLDAQTEEELAKAAGDVGTTIFHPVGTCRMGVDQASVVDPELKVRGVTGLRVVDASIMPTITSGNTNSPTIMIAEKAAEMILSDKEL